MRLFVGTPVTEPLLAAIRRWRTDHNDLDVRWIENKNLHFTLLPPWEADTAKRQLRQVVYPPQVVTLNRLTLGSNPKQVNLVWATGRPPAGLLGLKHAVESGFGKAPSESFLPHVTLAKFDRNNVPAPIRRLDETIKWQQNITEIALYRAQPTGNGSEYSILATRRLA